MLAEIPHHVFFLQNRVPKMSQEPTRVCYTVRIVDCLLVSFHPEELRLMLLPSLPSGSIRAMADLDAGCISEAGLERLDNMHGKCCDPKCVTITGKCLAVLNET